MKFKKGFTLAEVLITLTIIGIIAAIVIPSLLANISEKAFDTQRKALYARFSQAIPAMEKLTNYGALSKDAESEEITDTATESFITEGLSKVMKISNSCFGDKLADCNFPETFSTIDGNTTISLANLKTLAKYNGNFAGNNYGNRLDTKAAAFETANGESILVYYNPTCTADAGKKVNAYMQQKMCVNFIYDLNGPKTPNMVGKDIGFISVFYSAYPVVVAPMPLQTGAGSGKQTDAAAKCKQQDPDSKVPNKEEVASMFINKSLIGMNGYYWSSDVITSGESGSAWMQDTSGLGQVYGKTNNSSVRCIKR